MSALKWAARSDTGRVRDHNQDRFHADAEGRLFLVADGMGGTAAGDVAAQIVVDMLPRYIQRYVAADSACTFTTETERRLQGALADLSTEIRDAGQQSPRQAGMGATVVVALVGSRQVVVGHLGDSRAYLVRRGRLRQLTEDHNLARALVESGDLTEEQAASHSRLRALTRYVGMRERPEPDVVTFPFDDGDRLLLCSDGVTTMLTDADLHTILTDHPDSSAACRALITAANDAGGKDNITAIVIQRTPRADESNVHVPSQGAP